MKMFLKLICPFLIFSLLLSGCGTVETATEPIVFPEVTPTETAEATVPAEIVVSENTIGSIDNFDYELWKDSGVTFMTLKSNGLYSCQWKDINNALFRVGNKLDCTKTWEELGEISIDYGAHYFPVGNSYLCIYGWSREPLVEYYVVESWGDWRPPGSESVGVITVDGAEYDVYSTTRLNQPSIDGTKTFQQFWSVRKDKSTEGTVFLSDHFRAWRELGLELGKLYEIALTVEGYQSSGQADIYQNDIKYGSLIP